LWSAGPIVHVPTLIIRVVPGLVHDNISNITFDFLEAC
jgi:hypothetical protein